MYKININRTAGHDCVVRWRAGGVLLVCTRCVETGASDPFSTHWVGNIRRHLRTSHGVLELSHAKVRPPAASRPGTTPSDPLSFTLLFSTPLLFVRIVAPDRTVREARPRARRGRAPRRRQVALARAAQTCSRSRSCSRISERVAGGGGRRGRRGREAAVPLLQLHVPAPEIPPQARAHLPRRCAAAAAAHRPQMPVRSRTGTQLT